MKRTLVLLVCLSLLTACAKPAPPPAPPPPFQTSLTVNEVMGHVVDPAADVVWAASGYVITEKGEEDLSPKTEAGWAAVANSAAMVAESANLLMLPGRARPEPEWNRYSVQLAAASLKAMKAAHAKDKQGVFDAGGEIYVVCTACHQRYLPQE